MKGEVPVTEIKEQKELQISTATDLTVKGKTVSSQKGTKQRNVSS